MSKVYHVLNGDALGDHFGSIEGDIIVMRECLIEGEVRGDSLSEILENRKAHFLKYYNVSPEGFSEKAIKEISKLEQIESGSTVNLWFEFDLFCQVNFWFIVHVVSSLYQEIELYFVAPCQDSWMGYGAQSADQLLVSYEQKQKINKPDQQIISKMWSFYQNKEWSKLKNISTKLQVEINQLEDVIDAQIARFPVDGTLGRPQQILKDIISELNEPQFGKIYRDFFARAGIYGFGDMQVKNMLDDMNVSYIDELND